MRDMERQNRLTSVFQHRERLFRSANTHSLFCMSRESVTARCTDLVPSRLRSVHACLLLTPKPSPNAQYSTRAINLRKHSISPKYSTLSSTTCRGKHVEEKTTRRATAMLPLARSPRDDEGAANAASPVGTAEPHVVGLQRSAELEPTGNGKRHILGGTVRHRLT